MIDMSAGMAIARWLANGVAIGNMIRQQALQQEAAEQERLRFEHERQVNDIETRRKLAQYTRPIAGGMVTEDLMVDMPEFDPLNPGTPRMTRRKTTLVRPVDKSRRVSYKTMDGDANC